MQQILRMAPYGLILPCLSWPVDAVAHGFAVRYDLPIPLGFYLAGAGATVVLSFVLLAMFARESRARADQWPAYFVSPWLARVLSTPWVVGSLRGISVALFLLVIGAALFGDENPFRNISTTFVWVIWWVGMMFVNTFVGDIWALVNPWDVLFTTAERVLRLLKSSARISLDRRYPERLGVWPAVVLYLIFAWLELIWGEGEDPRKLSVVIIGYSLLTWAGMIFFGRRTWLSRGEAFSVVFSTFARFAPMAVRAGGLDGGACSHGMDIRQGAVVGCAACFESAAPAELAIVMRLPGAGLLVQRPVSVSTAALVLTLLATVTFDGFFATPAWTAIYEYCMGLAQRAPWIPEEWRFYVIATPLLLLFPVAFAAAFLICCRMTAAIDGGTTTTAVARNFVLTLLPIAIAYHFAHYLLYLLLTGQFIIPNISDPFGFGWNLFGTASYKPDIGLVGARFAWYTGVIAIVTGHVIAVYLAHRTALRLFRDGRRALASQFPMLALMVAYTMLSLWIIAQPAVR